MKSPPLEPGFQLLPRLTHTAAGSTLVAAGLASALCIAPIPAVAQSTVFDTNGVGEGPGSRACMLLERTIFQVDVLTLDVRFGPETASSIRRLVEGGAQRDSLAAVALRSRDAYARVEFVRDVGMDRFIDAVRDDLSKAAAAGIIDQSTFQEVSGNLPRWYSFLEDRGIRKGDQLLYRVRGDTLHSAYRSVTGEWLLSQTDVGPERRLSVLGSYFVDGSSFREGLLDSLSSDSGC